MFADGTTAAIPFKDVRPRSGDAHPVTMACEEAQRRLELYEEHTAVLIQVQCLPTARTHAPQTC